MIAELVAFSVNAVAVPLHNFKFLTGAGRVSTNVSIGCRISVRLDRVSDRRSARQAGPGVMLTGLKKFIPCGRSALIVEGIVAGIADHRRCSELVTALRAVRIAVNMERNSGTNRSVRYRTGIRGEARCTPPVKHRIGIQLVAIEFRTAAMAVTKNATVGASKIACSCSDSAEARVAIGAIILSKTHRRRHDRGNSSTAGLIHERG